MISVSKTFPTYLSCKRYVCTAISHDVWHNIFASPNGIGNKKFQGGAIWSSVAACPMGNLEICMVTDNTSKLYIHEAGTMGSVVK